MQPLLSLAVEQWLVAAGASCAVCLGLRLLTFLCSNRRCRPRTALKTTRRRWLAAKLRAAKSRRPQWKGSRRGPSGKGPAWQQLCSVEQ